MNKQSIAFVFSALLGVASATSQGAPQVAPPLPVTYGAPDFLAVMPAGATTGSVTKLSNGTIWTNLENPLAFALNKTRAGDVVAANGTFPGLKFGIANPGDPDAVFRANGGVFRDVVITTAAGAAAKASIGGVWFTGNYQVAGQHGADDVLFDNVVLRNGLDDNFSAAMLVYENSRHGMLRLYDVDFVSVSPAEYYGYGMKWNVRAQGRASYDFRGLRFTTALEHALYIDSPGYDQVYPISVFQDLEQPVGTVTGRTGIQIVNRASEGPSGRGTLYFNDVDLRTEYAPSGGGSAFTIAGHLGLVYVDGMNITTTTGGIVVWTDTSHGVHLNPAGYSTDAVVLKNITINAPNADRDHVMISGVQWFFMQEPFAITGNQTALHIWPPQGGPIGVGFADIDTGIVPVSQYAGWQSAIKMKYIGIVLSDAIIDAL